MLDPGEEVKGQAGLGRTSSEHVPDLSATENYLKHSVMKVSQECQRRGESGQ